MDCNWIGIDIAKRAYEVAVSREAGRVCERKRLSKPRLMDWLAQREASVVVMEACGSAHALGRAIVALGHDAVLLPPHRVRPYVTGYKTDRTDAKGILEAFRNEEILPVPLKSAEQQAILALHRLRKAWMGSRNRRLNTLRAIFREFGVAIPVGARKVLGAVYSHLEELPELLKPLVMTACEEVTRLNQNLDQSDRRLKRLACQLPDAQRLLSIPGIGPLSATALVAEIQDPTRFASGRHLASYLGLVPHEHSSGNTRRLGRISKRGNRYLRTLLIHGARSVLTAGRRSKTPSKLQRWALALEERTGHHKAKVALANRLTRVVWSVWTQKRLWKTNYKAA